MYEISRRSILGVGAATALGLAAPMIGAPAMAVSHIRTPRPTGQGYVRYEDLYRSGDTVTKALARLSKAAIVTFPEGRFSCSDFKEGWRTGISIPKICKGIVGSGRGTLGGDVGTIFTMRPETSKIAHTVPKQGSSVPTQAFLISHADSRAGSTWANFQVVGTEQHHVYNGLMIYNPGGKVSISDLLVAGTSGNNGAPPGESMSLILHSRPGGSSFHGHQVTRVEADGRRRIGGRPHAAVGFTIQNSVGVKVTDCHSHHNRASQVVIFQSFNTRTTNLRAEALYTKPKAVGQSVAVNHERTSGTVHDRPALHVSKGGVHMTHSNDAWWANYDDTRRSVKNGTLKVSNAKFNDIWKNGRMFIQSWDPYEIPGGGGDTMKTPPKVSGAKAQWVHGSHRKNVN